MTALRVGDNFSLPIETATEKLAFLGRTGTGKTYAAMKLAEEMLSAGVQVVVLDAVGKWYGLRVAGAGPGFPIPVFGGLEGDLPLESTGGKLAADVVAERGISAVLDVSQFTHGEQVRFAADFATQFFQRKKASPSAVHLFLEECQEFVPQNAMPGEQVMLAAFERLWKLGRNFGIGGSLISQRPQEVNKKALNQTGTLFVFGMTGPQERKAVEQWVSSQGINEDIGDILPTLRQGEPHVWSPTFLGVSRTVRVGAKRTADVSSTPKVGGRAKSRPLTPIDAEELRQQMAATVERAKADDPKELRRRVAELERQLRERPPATVEVERVVEVPVLKNGQLERTEKVADRLTSVVERVTCELAELRRLIAPAAQPRSAPRAPVDRAATKAGRPAAPGTQLPPGRPAATPVANHAPQPLPKAERRILAALAQYPGGRAKRQVAVLTGYAVGGGGFGNALSSLRTKGFVGGTDPLRITDAGLAALGPFDPLPVGRDLLDYWTAQLGKAERSILSALADAYPAALAKEEVARRAGYEPNGGGFNNAVSRLRMLELISGRGELRASDDLFG